MFEFEYCRVLIRKARRLMKSRHYSEAEAMLDALETYVNMRAAETDKKETVRSAEEYLGQKKGQ